MFLNMTTIEKKLRRYEKMNISKFVGKYVRLTLNDEPEPIEGRLEYGKFFEADGCDYWVYMEDWIVRGIPSYRIKEIEEI